MPTPILMPALSPTMEAGTLSKWLVKEGDVVSSGDVIAEIETDKATMEVEAVDEGTMGRFLVAEGTADVPVNQPIALLLAEGEDASALDSPSGSGPASAASEGEAETKGAPPRTQSAGAKGADDRSDAAKTTPDHPTDAAPEQAEQEPGGVADGARTNVADRPANGGSGTKSSGSGSSGSEGSGSGSSGSGTSFATAAAARGGNGQASANGAMARSDDGGRVFASPLARRLAEENGVELARVTGSGPHGRVVKRDVEEAVASGSTNASAAPEAANAAEAKSAPAPAAGPAAGKGQVPAPDKAAPKAPPPTGAPPGLTDDQIRAMFEKGSYTELPHDGMRKTIARRLVESKQTIPHFYLTVDTELDALLKLRADLNNAAPKGKDGQPSYKLSVNDFVIKAMALALKAVPMANATFTSTARLLHKDVDVGVAVAVPDGLITPVIRKADSKTLSLISGEMKDLAKRARDKKLQPSEYLGGSTAVSNLGMFGIRDFAAVINPPQGSILAVGEGSPRPVVKDGVLAIATVMTVTLSVDHRAVDGALGAEVLQAFKGLIEAPMRLLV